jgi:hypothetical protein
LPVGFETSRPIEVVIPFTTMAQVQASLKDAARLCTGLDANVRVVRVVVVPYPLDLDRPAVPVSSIVDEMAGLSCDLPLTLDVRLSREKLPTLVDAMGTHPLVLLTTKRRVWRTKEERLALALQSAGHEVLMSYEGAHHA